MHVGMSTGCRSPGISGPPQIWPREELLHCIPATTFIHLLTTGRLRRTPLARAAYSLSSFHVARSFFFHGSKWFQMMNRGTACLNTYMYSSGHLRWPDLPVSLPQCWFWRQSNVFEVFRCNNNRWLSSEVDRYASVTRSGTADDVELHRLRPTSRTCQLTCHCRRTMRPSRLLWRTRRTFPPA